MSLRRIVFAILAACGLGGALGGPAMAQTTLVSQINAHRAGAGLVATEHGVALGGYDVVSFHDGQQPLEGTPQFQLMWKGATWLFASAENMARFEQDPRRYEPQFGSYCALAVSQGGLSKGDPLRWQIRDGRLYFFHSDRAEEIWEGDAADLIVAAEATWPGVLRNRN